MTHRLLLALAAFCIGGCTATKNLAARYDNSICQLVRIAEMPVEMHANMLFVRATILDAPVILLIDTGAQRTLLTEATVDRLHLARDYQHATRTFGIGSPTSSWDATLPDGLTLGGTHLPVDSVTVGRFDIIHISGEAADGLLGADVLMAFDIDLDMANDRLTLYRARGDCPGARPPWKEPYTRLTGIVTRQDRLLVPFELDGTTGLGVLDTGAQLSSISKDMAERLGVEEGELGEDTIVMAHGAAPDEIAVRIHHFKELRVGPAVMHSPALPVVPMSDGMGDALVGADFLQGRRIWMSFAANRVFVTPIERGPAIAAAK